VSLPGGDGGLCELRAAGAEQFPPKKDADTLISLLKTFGAQLAAHPEQFFGPSLPIEKPTVVETPPQPQRKAA
jgi:hypothetical protein